jgi:uncharacterized protein YjbI with pentapeptide repeats
MSSSAPQSRLPSQALHETLAANANGQPADLTGQDLQGMDFVGYEFAGAKVSGADFRDSTITPEQALTTKGWLLARWSPAILEKLGLPTDHNERVQSKNFRGYALRGAHLNDLDLSGAILAEATLDKADLTGANLEFAHLEEASLRNADLTNTQGLNAYQLRGSDLTLAKLPPDIADSLKTQPGVDEATKTSRKVFLTMLAACLYCWLTILSTTDAGLLIGSSTLALPIVQTPIPVVAFFGAAPVLLLIVYLYLHFSLQNLWNALATLPAFFPDGRPVHERALPWILSPIVRLYFKRLIPFCTRLPRFQVRATSLLVWWGVPFTLIAFLLRFLVRHNAPITTLHVIVVGVSFWLSAMFWRITKDTLRGKPPGRLQWLKVLRSREVLAGVMVGALLALFSAGCFYGEPAYSQGIVSREPSPWAWQSAAPKLLDLVGWNAFGDLSYADLSRRPDDWDGKDLNAIKGAQLQGRVLRAVNAKGAFGPKANFIGADLRQAFFYSAYLRGADFSNAQLEQTFFAFADLRSGKFYSALTRGARFDGANIEGADFLEARGLEPEQISRARNWFLAYFEDDMLRDLAVCDPDKPCDHKDRLWRKDFSGIDLTCCDFEYPDFSGANLRYSILSTVHLEGADLAKADLRDAELEGTYLDRANLTGADLRGVNLKTVLGLTRAQIESALTDDKTQLPPYLEAQKPFTPKK